MDTPTGHEQNADQIAYWNGPGGVRWAERQASQDILLAPVAEILIDRAKPAPGERVIDVGCGSGATTNAFAQKVGLSGHVFGIDVSGPLLERRRKRRSIMRLPTPRFIRSIRKVLICWPRASA
jgi:protein-L-isoaspartate O-methyltransferase